jgi:hypothetical protein
MLRGVFRLIAAFLAASIAMSSGAPQASAAWTRRDLLLRSGSQTCYSASEVTQVDKHAPLTVVSPVSAVATQSHLRLTQVSLARAQPWTIKRILPVGAVAALCSHHASARFVASVYGYVVIMSLQGGGGWVGRLFTVPDSRAFHAGDTTPFVQVWSTRIRVQPVNGRRVAFHGILACDAPKYRDVSLPGWTASITPDRFSYVQHLHAP